MFLRNYWLDFFHRGPNWKSWNTKNGWVSQFISFIPAIKIRKNPVVKEDCENWLVLVFDLLRYSNCRLNFNQIDLNRKLWNLQELSSRLFLLKSVDRKLILGIFRKIKLGWVCLMFEQFFDRKYRLQFFHQRLNENYLKCKLSFIENSSWISSSKALVVRKCKTVHKFWLFSIVELLFFSVTTWLFCFFNVVL